MQVMLSSFMNEAANGSVLQLQDVGSEWCVCYTPMYTDNFGNLKLIRAVLCSNVQGHYIP